MLILSVFFALINFSSIDFEHQNSKADSFRIQDQPKRKLIVFSGSDWCKNCIRFKSEVLTNPEFLQFARENIEIITADFPQKTKLPKEQVEKNEALAEKYNKDGEFPRLVLLSKDGTTSRVIPFTNQSSQEFVNELKHYLSH